MTFFPRYNHAYLALTALLIFVLGSCDSGVATRTNNIQDLQVNFNQEAGLYTLTWTASDPSQPVSVLVSTPRQDFTVIAHEQKEQYFEWKPESLAERYLFKVSPSHGQTDISATRWLTLEGGRNFRELGGYRAADGNTVRWGKLFRSGAMGGLTDPDYRELEGFDIATIVDFRTQQERNAEPTLWQHPDTELLAWDSPLDFTGLGKGFGETGMNEEKVEAMMAAFYPEILEAMTIPYTALFDRLAASDAALVFNCTAGKDRTGVAAALILTALGVNRETIIEDFMLSDAYYNEMTSMHEAFGSAGSRGQPDNSEHVAAPHQPAQDMMAAIPPEALRPLAGVRKSYLEAVFAAMEKQSGTALAYLQQELQVTDEELAKLREHYLVSAPGF